MKPKRIILVRHGESQGNVNKTIYSHTPDYAIYLTDEGINQANRVGLEIKNIIGDKSYCAYYSPYFRARQTMDLALNVIDNYLYYNKVRLFKREEPRIREQEYAGSLRITADEDFEEEREKFGKFFYRLQGGESAADVYDRVSDFIGTLHRDFEKENYPENCLIFGHGMTNRLFIMRWLHIPIEEFETWKNPRNGEIYILELQENNKYKLVTEMKTHPKRYGYKYEFNGSKSNISLSS